MGFIRGGVLFKILVFLCFIRLSQGTFHLVLQFIYASQNWTVNHLPQKSTMFQSWSLISLLVYADQLRYAHHSCYLEIMISRRDMGPHIDILAISYILRFLHSHFVVFP
jgi:hypothetical protein